MSIYLKPEFKNNIEAVQKLICSIEITTIYMIILKSEIYYDPDLFNSVVEEDNNLIINDMPFMNNEKQFSAYVLRMEIDSVQLAKKGLKFKVLLNLIEK